MAEWRVCL